MYYGSTYLKYQTLNICKLSTCHQAYYQFKAYTFSKYINVYFINIKHIQNIEEYIINNAIHS